MLSVVIDVLLVHRAMSKRAFTNFAVVQTFTGLSVAGCFALSGFNVGKGFGFAFAFGFSRNKQGTQLIVVRFRVPVSGRR